MNDRRPTVRTPFRSHAATLPTLSMLAALLGACAMGDPGTDTEMMGDLSAERAYPNEEGASRTARVDLGGQAAEVNYEVLHGQMVFEGDIILGDLVGQAPETAEVTGDDTVSMTADGLAARTSRGLWPNRRIPYVVDARLPNTQRVRDAIAHWHANTQIRFVHRTTERDYVVFVPGSGCSSYVGRTGGRQNINLASGCGTGSVIHEMGHAVGLWHEQSRTDRADHVRINWDNIQSGRAGNFQTYRQQNADGQNIGVYDLGSIMHYGSYYFSRNGRPTIVTLRGGIITPNRSHLSARDIAGVARLYGY